eukprot:30058-Pelagococcus_subviridis.AAC.6
MTGSDNTMNTLGPNASLKTPPYFRKYGYSARKMGPPTRSSTEPSQTGAPSLLSSSPYVCEGRSIRANVGVELKGVRSGIERRRGRGLKARDGRRETTGKVLKDRRSPRGRGRMGTS